MRWTGPTTPPTTTSTATLKLVITHFLYICFIRLSDSEGDGSNDASNYYKHRHHQEPPSSVAAPKPQRPTGLPFPPGKRDTERKRQRDRQTETDRQKK